LPLAEGSAALEQGKLAFAEVSAPGAEFRVALIDLKLSFSEGATLVVGGDLVKFAEFVSGLGSAGEVDYTELKQLGAQSGIGHGGAICDRDQIGSSEWRTGGWSEGEGFEATLIVAGEFHPADGDAVGFKEELLCLLIGETVEPMIHLGELFVGEGGEFSW